MAPENGGGPEVTIGQQVGQNLYVKVEQGIGDASQTNFILEYELTKWLRLRTNVLQGSKHAGPALSADAGQRRRYVVLLQLLATSITKARRNTKTTIHFVRKTFSCASCLRDECDGRYATGSEATCTRASLKQAPAPRSVSVSGASAVAVTPLRVLRLHNPFGRLTVPGRIVGSTCSGQCTSPSWLNIRTRSPSDNPRFSASSGCISSLTSGRGSSPRVELIVRSLAGDISVSGNASVAGSG